MTRLRGNGKVCLGLLLGAWLAAGCTGPTVNLATQRPIEIQIDLRHEVRLQIDQDMSQVLGREAVRTRGDGSDEVQHLEAAKARGALGEQWDGYLGSRSGASTEDRALVARANEARRGDYARLAREHAVPREQVERVAGASRIQAAPPQEFVRAPSGEWVKREATTVVVVEEPTRP